MKYESRRGWLEDQRNIINRDCKKDNSEKVCTGLLALLSGGGAEVASRASS